MKEQGVETLPMKTQLISFSQTKKRILTLLILSAISFTAKCSFAEDKGKGADPDLVRAIDKILDVPGLQTGFQGVVIQSLRDNAIMYERNGDQVFLPASNNKLLTSCAALALLGPDFVYQTQLLTNGKLSEAGTLQGDLILKGSGSPILSIEDLDVLAKQAKAAGLKRVRGKLGFDDSRFDRNWIGNDWASDDLSSYYAAEVSGLNVNHNIIKATASPGAVAGDPVKVEITPPLPYLVVQNRARTGKRKSENSLTFDRLRGQNVVVVSGSLPLDIAPDKPPSETLTIENPPRFTATLMQTALKKQGVKFDDDEIAPLTATEEPEILAEHTSVPLSEILIQMNKPSDNLIAECLMKTIGAVKKNKGTWEDGISVAKEWFGTIGMDTTRVSQADGSGLSRFNYVSPRNYVKLLAWYYKRPNFPILYDSLAIAGVDGTLAQFGNKTALQGNLRAKDGYIGNVSSLTGFVKSKDGEIFIFSILMNNHLAKNAVCRTAQAKIALLLAEYKGDR